MLYIYHLAPINCCMNIIPTAVHFKTVALAGTVWETLFFHVYICASSALCRKEAGRLYKKPSSSVKSEHLFYISLIYRLHNLPEIGDPFIVWRIWDYCRYIYLVINSALILLGPGFHWDLTFSIVPVSMNVLGRYRTLAHLQNMALYILVSFQQRQLSCAFLSGSGK